MPKPQNSPIVYSSFIAAQISGQPRIPVLRTQIPRQRKQFPKIAEIAENLHSAHANTITTHTNIYWKQLFTGTTTWSVCKTALVICLEIPSKVVVNLSPIARFIHPSSFVETDPVFYPGFHIRGCKQEPGLSPPCPFSFLKSSYGIWGSAVSSPISWV